MTHTSLRLLGVATATVVIAGLAQVPGSAETTRASAKLPSLEQATTGLGDLDLRGKALPAAQQRSAAATLGTVRWNALGTPASIAPSRRTTGSRFARSL